MQYTTKLPDGQLNVLHCMNHKQISKEK